jgi:hypothetical protein
VKIKKNSVQKLRQKTRPASVNANKNNSGVGAITRALKGLLPAGSFQAAGGAIGGALGGPAGMSAGQALGAGIAKLTGFGDYSVKYNSFSDLKASGKVNAATLKDGVRLRHSEYLADVRGSQSFELTTYPINPALPTTFPLLSQIAESFEQYKLHGIVFEFRTAASMTTTGSSVGLVMMATNYDPLDPPWAGVTTMMSYENAISGAAYANLLHLVECDPEVTNQPVKYTRTGAVPPGGDIRVYDWGSFGVATSGMQSTGDFIGQLIVHYDIELIKPRITTSPASGFEAWCGAQSSFFGQCFNPVAFPGCTPKFTMPERLMLTYNDGHTELPGNSAIMPVPGYYTVTIEGTGNGNISLTSCLLVVGSHIAMPPSEINSNTNDAKTYSSGAGGAVFVKFSVQVVTPGYGTENWVTLNLAGSDATTNWKVEVVELQPSGLMLGWA